MFLRFSLFLASATVLLLLLLLRFARIVLLLHFPVLLCFSFCPVLLCFSFCSFLASWDLVLLLLLLIVISFCFYKVILVSKREICSLISVIQLGFFNSRFQCRWRLMHVATYESHVAIHRLYAATHDTCCNKWVICWSHMVYMLQHIWVICTPSFYTCCHIWLICCNIYGLYVTT